MRLSLSVFFIILFQFSGFGQRIFRDGYVIKNSSDTLNGLVQFSASQKVGNKCLFKRFDVAEVVEYNAAQIKGFGYKDGNFYESFNINGQFIFLECLIKGDLSLYFDGSNEFYCKTSDDFVCLKGQAVYGLDRDAKSSIYEYFVFRNKSLATIISPNIRADKVQLVDAVKKYNQQVFSSFIVYNREYRKGIFDEATMFTGANRFGFGVTSILNSSSSELNADYSTYNNMPRVAVNSNDWSFGLFCNYKFSRMNTNWSLQGEVNVLSRGSYYHWVFREIALEEIVDLQTDMTIVKFPLLIRYEFTKGRLQPFVNVGLSLNFAFFKYNNATLTAEAYRGEIYAYNSEILGENDRSNFRSFFAGGGFKYKVFGDKYVSLEARYWKSSSFGYSFDFDYRNSPSFAVSQNESYFQIIVGIGI